MRRGKAGRWHCCRSRHCCFDHKEGGSAGPDWVGSNLVGLDLVGLDSVGPDLPVPGLALADLAMADLAGTADWPEAGYTWGDCLPTDHWRVGRSPAGRWRGLRHNWSG